MYRFRGALRAICKAADAMVVDHYRSCLRNVVALFHVLEKEMAWRESTGNGRVYGALRAFKPIVAVGAEHALEDEILMADHFRKNILVNCHVKFVCSAEADQTQTVLMDYTVFTMR